MVLASNGVDQNNALVLENKKERLRLNARNHYKRNRDLILAKKKIYNDKNKERIKEYRKNYWVAKKERLKLKQREYLRRKNVTDP